MSFCAISMVLIEEKLSLSRSQSNFVSSTLLIVLYHKLS